jgi:MoaD family protein
MCWGCRFPSMKVTLHTILGIKEIIGQRLTEIELPDGSTIEEFLTTVRERWGDRLSARLFHPDSGAILPYVRIMVNGQAIDFLDGMQTSLKDGDEVLILPPVSGG